MNSKEYYWGKTSQKIKNIFYTWTIENYGLLKELQLDVGLTSPTFPNNDNGLQFYLEIVASNCTGPPHLHVRLRSSRNSVKNAMGKLYLPGVLGVFYSFELNRSLLICFKDSYETKYDGLTGRKLTLHCEIILIADIAAKCESRGTLIKVPNCKLAKHFGDMLNTQELADFTIITGDGHKIPVHKFILSARSKVFAAMFKHPLKENIENSVVISDFTFDIVTEMLQFMYTGEAPKLEEMPVGLMAAADKYELDRLKAMCAKCLRDNLSVESALIVLKTADHYNIKDLMIETIQFIQINIDEITKTSNWKNMITTDRKLILEALGEKQLYELKPNDAHVD